MTCSQVSVFVQFPTKLKSGKESFLMWGLDTSWSSNVQCTQKYLGPIGIPLKRSTSGNKLSPAKAGRSLEGWPWGKGECWSQPTYMNARLPQHTCQTALTNVKKTTWNCLCTNYIAIRSVTRSQVSHFSLECGVSCLVDLKKNLHMPNRSRQFSWLWDHIFS